MRAKFDCMIPWIHVVSYTLFLQGHLWYLKWLKLWEEHSWVKSFTPKKLAKSNLMWVSLNTRCTMIPWLEWYLIVHEESRTSKWLTPLHARSESDMSSAYSLEKFKLRDNKKDKIKYQKTKRKKTCFTSDHKEWLPAWDSAMIKLRLILLSRLLQGVI